MAAETMKLITTASFFANQYASAGDAVHSGYPVPCFRRLRR